MSNEVEPTKSGGAGRPRFHPELRRAAFLTSRLDIGPRTAKFLRDRRKRRPPQPPPALADVAICDHYIPGPDSNTLRIRVFSPIGLGNARPALLWMHAGGFLFGHPEQDQDQSIALCRTLGLVVAAVAYRYGPEHPFPAPLDDCYSALAWLHAEARNLGIDAGRIAVGGASSGGCLAAGLTLLAHDRGAAPIAFQLMIYPGLDDRTTLRRDIDELALRICRGNSNRLGWSTYLGGEPGREGVPAYAAPARREDLSGLPPAWIGIGSCDLYREEATIYAKRLRQAGVPCELNVVEGAFHAFDLVAPKSQVVADFRRSYIVALNAALGTSGQRHVAASQPAVRAGIAA